MSVSESGGDPAPSGLVLDLDEAFRVLEAIEDAPLKKGDLVAWPVVLLKWPVG